MPLPEQTRTIDLEPVGAPEWSVTFKRFEGLPYAEMLEIFGTKANEGLDDLEMMKRKFSAMIVSWNICDYDDSPFPQPSDDPNVAGRIPSSFAEYMGGQILEDANKGLGLARGSVTNSQDEL